MQPRRPLTAVLDPRFYAFLIRRLLANLHLQMAAFVVERAAAPGGGVARAAVIRSVDGLRVGPGCTVGRGAELIPAGMSALGPSLVLGRAVKIRQRVQLGAVSGRVLSIGDFTSIHNGCILLGDVRVGRHCLLSNNVFMSSGDHFARVRPPWLIKDQDAFVAENDGESHLRHAPVIVDDDCWIGWGAVIRRGVRIGRGAIIGANSVVTTDVEPYTVAAGAPCRVVSERLPFEPPVIVRSSESGHIPYFYAGFDARRQTARECVKAGGGVPVLDSTAVVVLAGGCWTSVSVTGVATATAAPTLVRVDVNGETVGQIELHESTFSKRFNIPSEAWSSTKRERNGFLGRFTVVELFVDRAVAGAEPPYRISEVSVEA